MGFKNNYINDINTKLMTKRFPDDIQTTLNIPIHKFKKVAEKFNYAVREVHADTDGAKMFHILLALQEYFDMEWIVDIILDDINKKIVIREMTDEYHIGVTQFKSKIPKPKVDPAEEAQKVIDAKIVKDKVVKKKVIKKKAVKKVVKKTKWAKKKKVAIKKKRKATKKAKVVIKKKKAVKKAKKKK
jgi:hypothetical protein